MENTFFIYSRTLDTQKIEKIATENRVIFLGMGQYLGYQIAFFNGKLNDDIRELASLESFDYSELDIIPELTQAGLLVMDMDSTAIKIECIDEIAKLAGTGEKVSNITARAMRGELDFEQSLRERVGTLKNASESILQKVRDNLPLMEGFEQLISTLKQYNWRIAIASGGFDYFADYLKQEYGLDEAVSNQLEVVEGKLTGNVLGRVVDAQYKSDTLLRLGEEFSIPKSQWVSIGDGANDLLMLNTASLGVAIHAKPKVQQQAKFKINFGDLSALALLLNAKNLLNQLGEK
ncbi:phosphoserine phosphatase SerB [Otariodibacter oris]|nr:phosphoserine phosphatase SerB [Otariodibacter oris]QGM81719.1 phosphoserine phosphatase SerB [Otariodibacter oris]